MVLRTAITAILIAIALVSSYTLIWLPNVKLLDAIVFLISYYFGLRYGLISAIVIRLIYGTFNPYGFELFSLFMVITGELFFVFFGVLFRKITPPNNLMKNNGEIFLLSFFAMLATFLFDFYTNALVGAFWYNSIILGIIVGIPFGLIHQISNTIIIPMLVSVGAAIFYRLGIHG